MKTKIAMVISIAGVLVAGSAAALVNTQVLSGSTSASPLAVDNGPRALETTSTVTVATSVTTPVVVAPTTPVPAAPAAAPAATQAIYKVGDAGSVTIDTAGDVLTIVAVTPANGWLVTKSETQDSTDAEVKFQSGTTEIQFHANLLFGVVTPSVESHDLSAPANSTTNSVDDSGHHSVGNDDTTHSGGGDDD